MCDEQVIKEKYGKDYTYEKWYSTDIDLEHLPKNKAVVFGDGETYCWMLTKKDKESIAPEPTFGQWIDVEINLPKGTEPVLTYNLAHNRYAIRSYYRGGWYRASGESTMNIFGNEESITKWMPLPKP